MDLLLQKLEKAKATSEDLPIWEGIRKELLPISGETDINQLEDEFLNSPLEYQDDDNPFPSKSASNLFQTQDELDLFVHCVFDRRFGWSEADQNGNLLKGKDLRKRESAHSNAQKKSRINERMDEFLKWFLFEKNFARMLISLKYTMQQAHSKPVVRSQTVIHMMDWLRGAITNIPPAHFHLVQDVIILGLTDIWSAIRNACVSRLSHVIEHFSLVQLQTFFSALVEICSESNWQAKEGAIMGINSIVRRFQWIGFLPDGINERDSSTKTEFFLKFGKEELRAMPEFISSQMHGVIFGLLAHPQLSVREHATKAYSSYISRCEFKEAQSSFNEVVQQLRRVIRGTSPPSLSAVTPSEFTFMDAYEADGLLQVCVHLVKHIPPGHLLPEWPKYFSTFCLYLMHPASTVRLSTSAIFKFLIARDSGNPILLKLVLQGLCADWQLDDDYLKCPLDDKTAPFGGKGSQQSVSVIQKDKKDNYSMAWEWREGRLLAYELIFQFLIKNHWLYTFGSSQLTVLGPVSNLGMDNTGGTSSDSKAPKMSTSFGSPNLHQPVRPSLSSSESATRGPTESSRGGHNLAMTSVLESNGEDEPMCIPVRRNSLSSTPGVWDLPPSRRAPRHNVHEKLVTVDELPALPTPAQYARLSRPRHSISITNPTHESPLAKDKVSYFQARRLAFAQNRTFTQASSSAGAAELSTQRLFTRLPTITGYTDQPSLHTLVRHYSYYTSPNSQPAMTGPSTSKAASLLMHALAMDVHSTKDGKASGDSTSPLCSPRGQRVDEDSDWFKHVELRSLSTLLEHILHQTVESIADERWELRRMGQQLLPCVVEVARWYDMRVLERLWDAHLPGAPSLLTYGSCLALRHSVSHAARLQAMLHDTPATWQDPEFCRHIILRITESVKHNLARWLAPIHLLLRRPILDRLTAIAMSTVISSHTHFTIDSDVKLSHFKTVIEMFSAIFRKVHPDHLTVITSSVDTSRKTEIDVTTEGFLCCSAISDGSPQFHAKQAEKHLLNDVLPVLSRFLRTSSAPSTSGLLPLLVFYLGHYAEEDTLSKALAESTSTLIQLCNAHATKVNHAEDKVFGHCMNALDQLATLLTDKTVDLQTAKQVMDFYLQLASQIPFSKHADLILRAISARMIQSSAVLSSPRAVNGSHRDLALRSNDIPVTTNRDADELSSEEDDPLDIAAEVLMKESQSLNISASSGNSARLSVSSVDGHQLRLASVESDEGSDWDDWSDEEEDQSAFSAAFSEFLTNLKAQIETPESLVDYKNTLASLPAKERRQIEALL